MTIVFFSKIFFFSLLENSFSLSVHYIIRTQCPQSRPSLLCCSVVHTVYSFLFRTEIFVDTFYVQQMGDMVSIIYIVLYHSLLHFL